MQQNDKKPGLSWSAPAGSGLAANTKDKQSAAASNGNGSTKQLLPAKSKSTSNVAMYTGMFVGGLIVGVLIAWGWGAMRGNTPAVTTTTSTSTQTTNTAPAGDKSSASTSASSMANSDLVVPSPQKAGQSVIVSNATVGSPTWVVVYENQAGAPGNILGAQLFFTSGPGIVTLLRATLAGQTYWVGTATDDGDRKFTKATDKPALNTDGTLSVVSFTSN